MGKRGLEGVRSHRVGRVGLWWLLGGSPMLFVRLGRLLETGIHVRDGMFGQGIWVRLC